MKSKCIFTKTSANLALDQILDSSDFDLCHCIYSKKSKIFTPIMGNDRVIFTEFDNYGKDCNAVLDDNTNNILVVVGLTDMIRPSNRCDIRFEYMYHFSKFKHKYIIDEVPFLQEKWRIWYPYGVLNPSILLFPHSYAIESAYRCYIDGLTEDDPLDVDWIVSMIKDYTVIDYAKYFDFRIEFKTHISTDEQRERYFELKDELFKTKKNVRSIISELSKYCQSILPDRNVFYDMRHMYDLKADTVFHITDLNVDSWIRSEIERIVSETNQITEALYNE